jgi:hypothetical protein
MMKFALVVVLSVAIQGSAALAAANGAPSSPSSPSPTPSATPSSAPATGNHPSVDPCALLTAHDAASVVGAVNPTPQRPSPNECLWSAAVATKSTGAVSQVLFTADVAQEAKHGCHGLGCLSIVQSVTGMIPGMSSFNSTLNQIGGTATMVEGIGQRAAWANGVLAVLQNQLIFKLQLSGSQSDMLNASESLAHLVVNNIQSRQASPQP